MLFQNVYSTILCTKSLGGRGLDRLSPLHRHPGVSLGQMVSELLVGRLCEDGLLPQVRGQVAVGLGDGIKGGLG